MVTVLTLRSLQVELMVAEGQHAPQQLARLRRGGVKLRTGASKRRPRLTRIFLPADGESVDPNDFFAEKSSEPGVEVDTRHDDRVHVSRPPPALLEQTRRHPHLKPCFCPTLALPVLGSKSSRSLYDAGLAAETYVKKTGKMKEC